jgi:hypothetical protein
MGGSGWHMTMDGTKKWKSESKGLRLRHRPCGGFLILIRTRNEKHDYITSTKYCRLSVASSFWLSWHNESLNIIWHKIRPLIHASLFLTQQGASVSMALQVAGTSLQTLETTVMCTTSCLFLGKTFTFKLTSILASFWCHWSLDTAIVVYVERRGILFRLSWALRAELVASYSAQSLMGCPRSGKSVTFIMLTSVLDQSSRGSQHRNNARISRHLPRMCRH